MADNFYADLEPFDDFAEVANPDRYVPMPDGWSVAVTDVVDSTGAIESGAYKEVNAIGTCCIVAGLEASPIDEIPYVFGGDGAALVVPERGVGPVGEALSMVRQMARETFGLELRVGVVPVADLAAEGHRPRVGRYRASKDVSLAMFAGRGLAWAEEMVKADEEGTYRIPEEPAPDHDEEMLENFHCRWEPIESRRGEMLTLLVTATDQGGYEAYQRVLAFLADCDREGDLRPADRSNLQMASQTDDFTIESRVKAGRREGWRMRWNRVRIATVTGLGRLLDDRGWGYFNPEGNDYIGQVVANSDFRKFDDTLRMVLDVTPEQREAIESFMQREREEGAIAYGTHVSRQALMTCMVNSLEGDHVHFVDGADGGYALAAKQLKRQLSQSSDGA